MEVDSTILGDKLFHFLIILLAKYLFLISVLVCLVKSLYEWPLVCVVVKRSKNSVASRSTKPFRKVVNMSPLNCRQDKDGEFRLCSLSSQLKFLKVGSILLELPLIQPYLLSSQGSKQYYSTQQWSKQLSGGGADPVQNLWEQGVWSCKQFRFIGVSNLTKLGYFSHNTN